MVLIPSNVGTVTVNTGNILSLTDIMKKPGQNPTEELSEALKITLKEKKPMQLKTSFVQNLTITRHHDDLFDKITLIDRSDLKIGIKIFISSDDQNNLREAIDQVFRNLNISSIDNIILAYNIPSTLVPEEKLNRLKNIWETMQTYAQNDKILQFGLSDIEEVHFKAIYEWAKVKPSIIQINLATCCVVPPTLQAFCKENFVQLLTHSDPSDILPENLLNDIFEEYDLKVNWALRFQVHIKCRGVLTTKGYLVNIEKKGS